ncbi:MAG: PfkB family carbohydrate kinase [Candidatus Calescibacterium sp.]|nr:PfkB family carbohydrate kinase [Candidatus Calescibacterium sp.]MDW8195327.1 PfkB family carbohydrate kinase [Candidatus Calescibacterium sp.]
MKITINSLLNKLEETIPKLKNKKILVVGDIILDRWLKGVVERISPEAPVPVLRVEKEWNDLGGAGNVAKILSYYSENVSLLGCIGKDQFGFRVKKLIKRYGINDLTFYYDSTIVKTRLVANNNQQIARVDRENQSLKVPLEILKSQLSKIRDSFECIFLIDYNKGLFTQENIGIINSTFKESLWYISIKPSNFSSFSSFMKNTNITLLSLNKQEFEQVSNYLGLKKDILSNMFSLSEIFKIENLMVTLGKNGLSIVNGNICIGIDGIEVEVFDVTGAGDNVISIFGLFNSVGFDVLESGMLANIGGSICVSRPGTIPVKPADLIKYLMMINKTTKKLPKYSIGGKP